MDYQRSGGSQTIFGALRSSSHKARNGVANQILS